MILPQKESKGHSLSITTGLILLFWIGLYVKASPDTHFGSFYGNAIADWSGSLVMVVATKFFYERGSKESNKPKNVNLGPFVHFCYEHSLTIFLVATGLGWFFLFRSMEPNSKWGQVVGNLLSEWMQVLGLVLMTKYLTERGAKV